jgi:hypothetical protein
VSRTPAAGAPARGGQNGRDVIKPRIMLLWPKRQSLARLRLRGLSFRMRVDEPATVRVTVGGRFTSVLQRARGPRQAASSSV